MKITPDIYQRMGHVLDYPRTNFTDQVTALLQALESADQSFAKKFRPFAKRTAKLSLSQLEEAYTHLFDLNPTCALEVGWHLYGESYERGNFLVKMRTLSKELGVAESAELPDHLPHLLHLLSKMTETPRRELAKDALLPAIEKIAAGLPDEEDGFKSVMGILRDLLLEEGK